MLCALTLKVEQWGMAGVGLPVTQHALGWCLLFTTFSFQLLARIAIASSECMDYYSMLERHFFLSGFIFFFPFHYCMKLYSKNKTAWLQDASAAGPYLNDEVTSLEYRVQSIVKDRTSGRWECILQVMGLWITKNWTADWLTASVKNRNHSHLCVHCLCPEKERCLGVKTKHQLTSTGKWTSQIPATWTRISTSLKKLELDSS